MTEILIKDAAEIVTPIGSAKSGRSLKELKVIGGGSVYIKDGMVKACGYLQDLERQIEGSPLIIDARGKAVLPGLVDPHTHLVFAGTREDEFCLRIEGVTYMEMANKGGGIVRTVNETREATKWELKTIAKEYLSLALQHGTTTMEVKSGYGLDLENELKLLEVIEELNREQPVELIPTFLGAHAIPTGDTAEGYVGKVVDMLPRVSKKSRFCDVFCEDGYFNIEASRVILMKAKEYGLAPRLHANQFTNNGGVGLAVEVGAMSVDHLERISEQEIEQLAATNICATLTPGVSFFLNYGYPPARRIIDRGCIAAIATNFNPGSCMCISMQMIIAIACIQMGLTPAEAVTAATLNAAYSLGLSHLVGSIEAGKQADMLIMDIPRYQMIPYFFGVNHVEMVIKRGEVVWVR